MNTTRPLYDDIGNVRERKNLYLKELYDSSAPDPDKSSHPYLKRLQEAKDEEKVFLDALKKREEEISRTLPSEDPQKKLKLQAFSAREKASFYQPLRELSYDFELKDRIHHVRAHQLPLIIAHQESLIREIEKTKSALNTERASDHSAYEAQTQDYKTERQKELQETLASLKEKRQSRLISEKAYRNEKSMAKRAAKDDVHARENSHPVKLLEDTLSNLQHRLKSEKKQALKVLSSDISDIRRKTPVEIEQKSPWKSLISFPLPGIGQLLSGQLAKGGLFLLASLFIYLIAIPYALGYGNYRGDGISGLISLAEGGARLDRSIIFMVEGIIAIFLLIFSVALLLISFRDAYTTEKKQIKGVRPYTWFESLQSIEEKGFPYLVSLPALIVIVFIVLVPIMTTILISFTNMDPNHQSKFLWHGITNYRQIALGQGIAGSAFWLILGWTLIWTLGASTLAIGLGFFLSLLVHQERLKGKKFFRTVFLLPWAVPAFITIMFFSIMVSSTGPITQLINAATGQIVSIKSSTLLTRLFLIFLQGWLGSSYIFLLSTGVLQGIPSDLYEAAEIDGATSWQKTMRITVPLILFQTAPLLVGQYTFNFNNFSIIFLFNQGGPFNPSLYGNLAGSTDILISYIYKLTIQNQYQAIGAAITIVISVALMFIAWLGYRNTKAFKEEKL